MGHPWGTDTPRLVKHPRSSSIARRPKGAGVNGGPEIVRQADGQFLVQILPSQILQGPNMGLQHEAVHIFLKFQELLRRSQPVGGLLDSGQKVTVLLG